jgi:hypothetical protein
VATSAETCGDTKQPLQNQRVPAELHDRCFNCFSYLRWVATCWLPQCCLHCHDFHHLSRDCKRPRHGAASAAKGGDRLWYPARGGNPTASQ